MVISLKDSTIGTPCIVVHNKQNVPLILLSFVFKGANVLGGLVQGLMQSEGGRQLGHMLTKKNGGGAVDLIASKLILDKLFISFKNFNR